MCLQRQSLGKVRRMGRGVTTEERKIGRGEAGEKKWHNISKIIPTENNIKMSFIIFSLHKA
jgi:hypothetical protein